MKILAIETSCDETGLALLEVSGGLRAPRFNVLKSLVASQIKVHQPFGGVVPNLAKREHLKNLPVLYKKMFGAEGGAAEKKLWKQIDFITVTVGPGLEPALWTGIEFAKKLSREKKKPLVGANHLEGHLYSFLLPAAGEKKSARKSPFGNGSKNATVKNIFPSTALIVSGGHTIILNVDSFSKWKHLGETRDDAAGEAFDKVARLLDLPYPGGPEVERLARVGDPHAINFPRPMLHDKNFDFSFSGLKTAVLYYLRDEKFEKLPKAKQDELRKNVSASFQEAALDVLVKKTLKAARQTGARSIILCGGVAANKALRARLGKEAKKIGAAFLVPSFIYNLDNAAMIGAAGAVAYWRKKKYPIRANGSLGI
ncbi:MAG TPA: tRNA (adenosine(37)-N6)-threonylcarbamoyltransferase complex transferase subunit TsaD [Candidatus Paceibacterota bacterium]|nr:tRNA (adenosine(37)-N6)-threonylcarbamoyltransferase complex transferase subunit TsaD [Candidatus Paceibacterota bacterium]